MSLFQTLKEFFRHHLIFLLIQTGLKREHRLPCQQATAIFLRWVDCIQLRQHKIYWYPHKEQYLGMKAFLSWVTILSDSLRFITSVTYFTFVELIGFKHFPPRTTLALIARCIAIILCFDLRRKLWVQFNFISIFHCFISNEV